jgi:hypothetical protein
MARHPLGCRHEIVIMHKVGAIIFLFRDYRLEEIKKKRRKGGNTHG